MSATRIYIVTRKGSTTKRLVEATSQAQALRHVAFDEFSVQNASAKEVATTMGEGVHVEDANAPIEAEKGE